MVIKIKSLFLLQYLCYHYIIFRKKLHIFRDTQLYSLCSLEINNNNNVYCNRAEHHKIITSRHHSSAKLLVL